MRHPPGAEFLRVARAVAIDHTLELVPVRLGALPSAGLLALAQFRIGQREAKFRGR